MAFSPTDIALLRSAQILRDLPDPAVLDDLFSRRECQLVLPPDEVFLTAGQEAPGLHVIAHGTVEMYVGDARGEEKIIEFARTGGLIGEETLFSDRPLQYSARTITRAAVLRIPVDIMAEWIAASPVFALRVMGCVAERIDYLYKDILTFCTKTAKARLVCYLVCHFDHAPRTPDGTHALQISVPRKKLASRLGVSESHLSRAFKELEEHGLIVRNGAGYFIPDVPALSAYVCPAGCDW